MSSKKEFLVLLDRVILIFHVNVLLAVDDFQEVALPVFIGFFFARALYGHLLRCLPPMTTVFELKDNGELAGIVTLLLHDERSFSRALDDLRKIKVNQTCGQAFLPVVFRILVKMIAVTEHFYLSPNPFVRVLLWSQD